MHRLDSSPFTVTPAAGLLARCVARGVLSQEEIDSASSRLSPAFSSHLHEAEQRIRTQRQLDQLQLEVELLHKDKKSADVSHTFYLTRRFQMFQVFCCHLQDVLKDQTSLRQRLMKPLGRTNLPVPAHLHRFMVDVVTLLLDFIETLEEKMDSVHCLPAARDRLTQLNTSADQLLGVVVELESLANQVLQRQEVQSSKQSDSSA
ncbi:HAUS augmin-like complex subunit 2 [Sander lucioperca]|uniref:HAUS augmin-like complex subunit 2 n=1 Tax=Sander lucioperca TaxID=283035 RepID=A0A8D0A487_SANLU|nr:HAUS augmin-like complex subunit 2 [Sander lucioperca]